MFMSCHVNLNLVLQIVLWLPTLQAFSSLVKGLYRNIDIRKYSFLTIDEMFLHSNLFHTVFYCSTQSPCLSFCYTNHKHTKVCCVRCVSTIKHIFSPIVLSIPNSGTRIYVYFFQFLAATRNFVAKVFSGNV